MKLEVFKSSYGYYNFRTVDGKPTEEMSEYLKTNGYRWSRNNNCWYPATAEAKEANLHDNFVLKFQEKFFHADVDQVKTEKLDSQSIDERITYLENLITELQEAHKQDLEKIRILENQLTNHEETIVDYYTQQEQSQLDEEAEWEKENSLTTEEEKEIIENQKNNGNVTPEPTESLDSFFYDEMADDEDIYDERAQEDLHAGMVINPKELFEAAERIAREEEPEAERVFSENISENKDVEVTPDELSIAKAVLPTTQYVTTLRYSQGEEGNFFKQKIKDVAAAVLKAPKIGGTDNMEQHPIVLRYFHPTGTETLITEIGKDGKAYGFQCLKGDYKMAEWGDIDLNEVKNIPGMELDYHIEEGMTVERWLYKEEPNMFPKYARFAGVEEKAQEPLATEKTPFDVAQESGNDIEAIVKAQREEKYLDEIAPNRDVKRYYYNSYADVFLAVKFVNGEGEYTFYDKDLNVIDGGEGYSGPDTAKPKNIVEYCEFAIDMRYSPDDIDPDGMTQSEYQERVERNNNYRLENWTFERESIFEEVLAEKGKESENIRKKIEIKPVSLEEILAVMDMRPEMTADGKILVFDEQRKEYIDNGEDFEGNGQEAWEFSDAAEIFERLDIFIKEAFIDDMEEQLNAVGIKYTEDGHARSLEECCELYKKEIENGNTQLSEGDLNLAFGIVNPETVILPEQIQARDELLSHVKYFVTEFAEFPSYDDTENMSLEDAVKAVRERNQQEHNFTTFGTNARFTVGIEIDGEKFGNDGASYNPETGNFETFMFEANSLFRKYGGVALEELAEEIKRQNNGLPPAMRLPCNFNPADFGLEENEEILIEAENGQMMTPDELRKWNEEKEMQHGQDSEFDEIKEGRTFALEAAKENVKPQEPTSKKDIKAIREQCRQILKKPDSEITESDKAILAQYEGAGGLNEENRTNAGILNEFYTPNNLVEKVWKIVDAYAPEAKTVLEPSAGVGKFANNRPNNEFTMHELDETSARINKILHPEAKIIQGAYQKQFFDDGERFKRVDFIQPKYDVVIGNPPYGAYNDKYKGLGEGKEFDRYEEYFISKGLDALKDENSVMAFVVPSGFLNTASDKQKELIASKGILIDAYRLPVGTFPTTEVGTDIIIMKPWKWEKSQAVSKEEMAKIYANEMSNGDWFSKHPEKILGEVKTRTNRFGKEEEYVAVHEGLTLQDELNKIDGMLPKIDLIHSFEMTDNQPVLNSEEEKINFINLNVRVNENNGLIHKRAFDFMVEVPESKAKEFNIDEAFMLSGKVEGQGGAINLPSWISKKYKVNEKELKNYYALIWKQARNLDLDTIQNDLKNGNLKLTESTMTYIRKVTDSWDNNNWQVISPNSGEVDASNFFNQYFTDFVGSEMEKNPQLRKEREKAIKDISAVAKQTGKTFYDLVDETIKAYLEEKHGYKKWDYEEVKKHDAILVETYKKEHQNDVIKLLRNSSLNAEVMDKLKSAYLDSVQGAVEADFNNLLLKESMTINEAVNQIVKAETYGQAVVDINKARKNAEHYFVNAGYELESELDMNNRLSEAKRREVENENQSQSLVHGSLNEPLTTEPTSDGQKTKTSRQKKEKWNIAKSKGEVMTAEEFSRLYGRDFDEREFPIWRATDWQGNINLENLSAEDLKYMHESGRYVQKDVGKWTHKVLFTSGNIYEKIEIQKMLRISEISRNGENSEMAKVFEKNIELLELSKKTPLDIEHIHFGLKTTLAEDFTITHLDEDGNPVELNLQESFILWAQNATLATQRWRKDMDYASSNISREELGEELTFYDIVDYIDGKSVKAEAVRGWRTWDMSDEEKAAEKAERKKEADLKRQTRADTANRLFDRYLHEGLDEKAKKRLEAEYNRRFNSYISPDYSKLPLFVDGMSAYKGDSKFKLYDQQIKGISFLCNKGNGLLAYDVGVGKTAAGIVATVNQIQTERSKRPLIIVPNQVYAKWYTDIKQLFPNVQVNDLYNFNKKSVEGYVDKKNPHKLNIPENSISLCTYEALKNITFTDESCENALYQDFANLLSADFDGSERENAASSDKIKAIIGSASHVKDSSYYFFEECGFDNLTVDEAHHFKNLWVVPKPKNKGESNEYSGIPNGKPSARALKMYGMTQLVQRNNDNRNVFMLTATPFTNSPTEVYSMLSYIGRERLHEAGISSLRSFFDEFAQTRQELGVNAKGEIDTKQVMKSWKELPALQSILTEFIDKVDGEEIKSLIRPKKFTHVKQLDMSELQKQMREIDEERMAEVKEGNSAAVIVAMNNMRLSCVAPALANPAMYPGVDLPPLSQLVETSPKLKFVCDAIIDMYKDNPEKGQFMYVPLGKESHGIIKDYLVAHGIPKEAVEIINGEINSTTEKKEKISGRFNDEKDKVKILIGGQNTTEGIDLNGNSFVMYNCSLGWNPSETIQAEGRIWRQGNLQGNVHIVYPVMNDSIDSVLYQKHDEKRSRINELWNYKGDSLNIEDINPEDLKLDLIKDPVKKSKLILQEETKEARLELSKINLKIKSFDEIIGKRKQLSFDFDDSEKNIQKYERQINEYKENGLEVPEWIKSTLKGYKKDFEKASNQKLSVEKKLASWNCNTPEEEDAYIRNLNNEKHFYEEKIQHIEEGLPEILKKLEVERLEQKIMEYPVDKQREILEADILNNLRPMSEVKHEIKTKRHENMLAEKLKAGEISQEEHDLYKSAGYEKYEKWLNGEIESLEDGSETHIANQEVPDIESDRQLSVENDTADIIDKKAQETIPAKQPQMENDPYNGLDLFTSMGISEDEMFVHSAEQLYFNFDKDDIYLTPEQLTKAEQKRDEIILPVLKGKETGMYKAFNNFAKHGVFDVLGTKIDMEDTPKGPAISADGWNQLHAAMNIYRDKSFETMRYVFVDRKSGEIKDQFAISSKMPNYCLITESYDNGNETIKELIMKAEETDSLIVAVHNHPSGNVTESMEDIKVTETLNKSFTRSDGLCRFGGHIILDHDNFNLWTPYTKTLKETKGWVTITDWERFGKKDELINENFNFPREDIGSTDKLFNVAKKINDTNSWNDDFIPVIFSNADAKICALQFYDKSFFDKDPQFIRNKLQFSGIESGAIRAFPVVTEACMNKLSGLDAHLLEEKMKNLVAHSAFSDAVLPDSTIVKKYNVTPGINLFCPDDFRNKKPDVQATWDRQIMNPTLFEQLQNGTLRIIVPEEKAKINERTKLKKASGMDY